MKLQARTWLTVLGVCVSISLAALGLSGTALAADGDHYDPGSLNVRIPEAFLPPPQEIEIEVPLEPGDPGYETPAEFAERAKKEREAALHKKNTTTVGGQVVEGKLPPADMDIDLDKKPFVPAKPRTKKIKKLVPAPSPYKILTYSDFSWLTNDSGHYNIALPKAYGSDPLKGLPISGPALIRNVSDALFMAATVDDPADVQHYKNGKTLPTFTGALPILKENRATVQNKTASCTYFNYEMEGTTCLVLQAEVPVEHKIYKLLYVFPHSRRYTFLPLSLYSVENFRIE
jgi:hypothetical protein